MNSFGKAIIGSVQDLDANERTICGWNESSVRPSQGRF
jgi:hypothetical protein